MLFHTVCFCDTTFILRMAPKSKPASNNTAAKEKPSVPSPVNGSATPVPVAAKDEATEAQSSAVSRPDRKAYDADQERIKVEIDALQAKLVRPNLFV